MYNLKKGKSRKRSQANHKAKGQLRAWDRLK